MLHSQGFMAHFQVVNNKQLSWRSDHLLKSCGSLLTDSLSSVFILEKTPENTEFTITGALLDTRENRSKASDNFFAHVQDGAAAGNRKLLVFRGFSAIILPVSKLILW